MDPVELPYEIKAACKYNGIDSTDIIKIVLEITGENEGDNWHWIVKTQDGYAYIVGWCDYSGWGCRSNAERFDGKTLAKVLALCPMDVRRVFEDMRSKKETVRPNTGGL